ncbi:MAG: sterol desaturase family protein [Ignavibacteriaceae bacterium]|jgi:sterol desaturase/sphingolipid hydroxylase (fatty acid hydroxylase superfamily)
MSKNFVSNKDVTIRMFDSNFMEAFSKVHPAVPLVIYLPVIGFFLYRAGGVLNISISNIIYFILFGIAVWTFTEYTLHRFIFHYNPKSEFGKKLHFIFHGVHHDYPNDSRRLVMPPSVSVPLAVLFYILFHAILGKNYVTPFFVGFLTGYLFYDMTHYAVHHFNIHNKFWLMLKKHHMRHHFQDAEKGFGVSSPLWDHIIGTNFPKSND